MAKKETMKELFERFVNDPSIMQGEEMEEAKQFMEDMQQLSTEIVQACLKSGMKNHEGKHWKNIILIALARATCKVIYAMEQSSQTENGEHPDIFNPYAEMLQITRTISNCEDDELLKAQQDMDSDFGMTREMRRAVILAIADPDRTPESILDEYFKKDLAAEQRQFVLDHIAKMRREKADQLRQVREMTDGKGDNKAN